LPVILCLVDPTSGEACWETVNAQTLVSTGKHFKVNVPRSNRIDAADASWRAIADQYDLLAERYYESNLEILPPTVAQRLSELPPSIDRAQLTATLAEGRQSPEVTLSLLRGPRASLVERLGVVALRAVAAFAQEHDQDRYSISLLTELAELEPTRAVELLCAAAVIATRSDEVTAKALLGQVTGIDPDHPDVLRLRLEIDSASDPDLEERLRKFDNVASHSYFARKAAIADDSDTVVTHLERLVELAPESTHAKIDLASHLSKRSLSKQAHAGDLQRALELASDALADRRRWTLDTVNALECVIRCLGLLRRFGDALTASLPSPDGTAAHHEAEATPIVRLALHSARQLGRSEEELIAVARRASDATYRQHALESLEPGTDPERVARRLKAELEYNERVGDFGAAAVAAMELATLGISEKPTLSRMVAAGHLPARYDAMIDAIAKSISDPSGQLPLLRELALEQVVAAEAVVSSVERTDGPEAALAATVGFETRYPQSGFTMRRVVLLFGLGRNTEAAAAAADGIATGTLTGTFHTQALELLGSDAASRSDWVGAERYFCAAWEEGGKVGDLWNQIHCLVELGDAARAKELLDRYEPEPDDPYRIQAWLKVRLATGWNATSATKALKLAVDPQTPPDMSRALAHSVLRSTRGESDESEDARPSVPDELHREAIRIIDTFIDAGDAAAGMRLSLSEENPLESLEEIIPTEPSPLVELIRQVQRGDFPIGGLVDVRHDPYGYLLLAVPAGIRVACEADDAAHELENEVARSALNRSVVVDLSAVSLATLLGDWSALLGNFNAAVIPVSQRTDSLRTVVEARAATATRGFLSRDRAGRLRLVEADQDEALRILKEAEQVAASTAHVTARSVTGPYSDPDLEAVRATWTDPLELAIREDSPLWSDDLAQRRAARSLGIQAFGTVNLLEVLGLDALATGRQSAEQIEAIRKDLFERLVDLRVVDIPVHIDQLEAAAKQPGPVPPVVVTLTRGVWWRRAGALEDWTVIAGVIVERADSAALRAWCSAALVGIAEATKGSPGASQVLAVVVALASRESELDLGVELMDAADATATDFGAQSPWDQLLVAAAVAQQMGAIDDGAALALALLRRRHEREAEPGEATGSGVQPESGA